jgi:hypothetical protein
MKQISLVILRPLEKKRGKAKQKATKNVKLKINYFYEKIPNLPIYRTIHCHPDGL